MTRSVTESTVVSPDSYYAYAHARESSNGNGRNLTHASVCVCSTPDIPHTHAHARIGVSSVTVTEPQMPTRLTLADLPGFFGFPSLRDHQRRAIGALTVHSRDVLIIAPTGGGKTPSYVGSGVMLGGLTLIVSPLRSLHTDQCRRLQELGLPVRVWNSDVPDKEKNVTLSLLNTSDWQAFVITSPESLKGYEFKSHLKGRVTLAVIDEAHCAIRDSGYRHAYAHLGHTLNYIDPAYRLACTATCPAPDRRKLIDTLHLNNPVVVTAPVARENIDIRVVARDQYTLSQILNKHKGQPGLIFVATIRTGNAIHAALQSAGRNVGIYHGELPAKEKKRIQTAFMANEIPVVIATDAFILGLDKSDIRFAIHYDPPKSVEDWCQGFGRVGRDGQQAWAYGCFGDGADDGFNSRRFLIQSTFPPVDHLAQVWDWIGLAPYRGESAKMIGERVLGQKGKYSGPAILSTLQRFRILDARPNPNDGRRRLYSTCGDFDSVDWRRYETEKADALARLDQLDDLTALPESEIPDAIDEYFAGEAREEFNPELYDPELDG